MRYILAGLLVLFATYSDIFLFRIGIIPFQPSSFLIPLFLVVAFVKYPVLDYIDIIRTHSFKMLAAVLFLSVIYAAFSDARSTVIIEKISLNLITLLLYTFAVHFFRTEDKKLAGIVMTASVFVLGGSVLYDFFIGLPAYSVELAQSARKGGFGENPNQAASGIKFLALAALVTATGNKLLRNLVIAFMALSVFLTFSRSGLASIVLILGLGALNNWNADFQLKGSSLFARTIKLVILFAVLMVSLVGVANIVRANFPQFTRGEAGKRLDLLTGNSKKSDLQKDAVSGGRTELLFEYIDEFKKKPLGYGTGYSSDKKANRGKLNTHNYYLYLGINLGFIALILFLIFVIYSVKLSVQYNQFYYFIFALLFIVEGFVTHSIFYERPITICLAFFDSIIYRRTISEA